MKYHQFFAILGNQCARFVPEEEAPENLVEFLDVLRGVVSRENLDMPLVEVFSVLMGPRLTSILNESVEATATALGARMKALREEKRLAEQVLNQQAILAAAAEQEAIAKVQADRQQLNEMAAKIQELETKIQNMEPKPL